MYTALYRVTVWLKSGEVHQGSREYETGNINDATTTFRHKAIQAYGNVKDVEAALLSDDSIEVKEIIAKTRKSLLKLKTIRRGISDVSA